MTFFAINLFGQNSIISRIDYCYKGENCNFSFNFKNFKEDSAKILIYSQQLDIEIPVLFKKGKKETLSLQDLGKMIEIIYIENGQRKRKTINTFNYPCGGKGPSKHDIN